MRAYKRTPPVRRCANDLELMVMAATELHGRCMVEAVGQEWTAVTFVPSATRGGPDHPVAALARQVAGLGPANRLLLAPGPGIAAKRVVRADRFVVPAKYRARTRDGHVLLVDDTWVSGGNIQSAAVALHDAGAARVTALCVGRWCDNGWTAHRALLDSCTDPYDPFVCPVPSGTCRLLSE
ncbi:hypothetical protein [Goodfellowiella coeruleoviolacea]|uniref:Phosphoribosyltransferase n=1 Tax=Goodfellowiella coeruleoviolacea TaxID=334858 RepID=A0AAE3GDK1_9PSEU|nr:hypothetical protein [Goodfellowiella coeruleoviolacea]MCP2166292.1 hypothetical protein [Goodfellowiella coeruleoviolacea]